MRNPERIERILEEIRAQWVRSPDLRLLQLLLNNLGSARSSTALYNVEDDELLDALRSHCS